MTAQQFVDKWSKAELSERAASQEHFIDLCQLLDQPTPASDSTGEDYCFEKPVKVVQAASKGSKGQAGYVDVWKRGCFAWEYKSKDKYKNLDEAYRQLYQYRDALDNPPLSVVCDITTTEIRTHFAGYPTVKTVIRIEELPARLEVFRRLFTDPDSFKATLKSNEAVTRELAESFSDLANRLIERYPPSNLGLFETAGDPVARFLMKVMFCLFAEDIGLLPKQVFTNLVRQSLLDPDRFEPAAADLFQKMQKGGYFGNEKISFFNGGLFDDAPPLPLNHEDLGILNRVAQRDWAGVEPSIFGTLFERILDPRKRAQIGAHYTSKADILLVIEPVIIRPLRRMWTELQEKFKDDLAKHDAEPNAKKREVLSTPIKLAIEGFRRSLGSQRILDPACGSGNFLYVALQQLLDLDDETVRFANKHDIFVDPVPRVRPTQMHGIEINPYAAELAHVVIWIGHLQWLHVHGIDDPKRPILDKLRCIENRDAILDQKDKKNPRSADWPEADFIVGNPPFLGSKLFRKQGLTDQYLQQLWRAFDLPRPSDLCCYWFELARRAVKALKGARAGLLATQGIRGGANRNVLDRIKDTGAIFIAWSDHDWVLDGAAVHVSIVGFDDGSDPMRMLDGECVEDIAANLRSGVDTTTIATLVQNGGIAFMGDTKGGAFDIPWDEARTIISTPNPTGRSTLDIIRPWVNGLDITRRTRSMFIIDFGLDMSKHEAAGFAAAFHLVDQRIRPERATNRREAYADRWWIHVEPRPAMREALPKCRFLGTPIVTKFRLFSWLESSVLPDHALSVFARDDDFFFGVLHSAVHELWSRRIGTQLREAESGFRYTSTTCFETFPLPWPPGKEDIKHPAYKRIAAAAKELNDLRERWLNPPEWLDPITKQIDATDNFSDVPAEARPLIRQSAIMAAAAKDARLKKRTLTNLYNERPTWLKLAHETLDRAVLAAYAAVDPVGGWPEDWAAVWVDTGAGQPLPPNHPLAAKRIEVDSAVLAALLRLNHERAGIESRPPRK